MKWMQLNICVQQNLKIPLQIYAKIKLNLKIPLQIHAKISFRKLYKNLSYLFFTNFSAKHLKSQF